MSPVSTSNAGLTFVSPDRSQQNEKSRGCESSVLLTQELKEGNNLWADEENQRELLELMDRIDPIPADETSIESRRTRSKRKRSPTLAGGSRRRSPRKSGSSSVCAGRVTRSQVSGRDKKKVTAKKRQSTAVKLKEAAKSPKRSAVLAKCIKNNLVKKNIPDKVQECWDVANENSRSYEL